jgi:hypothetical protein
VVILPGEEIVEALRLYDTPKIHREFREFPWPVYADRGRPDDYAAPEAELIESGYTLAGLADTRLIVEASALHGPSGDAGKPIAAIALIRVKVDSHDLDLRRAKIKHQLLSVASLV